LLLGSPRTQFYRKGKHSLTKVSKCEVYFKHSNRKSEVAKYKGCGNGESEDNE